MISYRLRRTLARIAVASLLVALTAAFASSSLAYKGELSASVVPISKALEIAESGDMVTVEGEVMGRESGQGNLTIYEIDDGTGSLLVAVSARQIRELREVGTDPEGHWVRVQGKWTHGYMKKDRQGIRAQKLEPIDR